MCSFYLKGRVIKRDEETKSREREKWPQRQGPGQLKLGVWNAIWVNGRGPSTWTILSCFARRISRQLDWKCNSQNLNHLSL